MVVTGQLQPFRRPENSVGQARFQRRADIALAHQLTAAQLEKLLLDALELMYLWRAGETP